MNTKQRKARQRKNFVIMMMKNDGFCRCKYCRRENLQMPTARSRAIHIGLLTALKSSPSLYR